MAFYSLEAAATVFSQDPNKRVECSASGALCFFHTQEPRGIVHDICLR